VFRHSFFIGKKVSPVDIHHELVSVYGGNVKAVRHVRTWCRKFDTG
jgi:hypothetical protein